MADPPTDRKPGELDIEELAHRFSPDDGDRFHTSYWVEVSNYLQHHKVRDRSAEEQSEIVRRTTKVMGRVFDGQVGASYFRNFIGWICTDDYDDCDGAGRTILGASNSQELASMVRRVARSDRDRPRLRRPESFDQ